jgi:hypothetical protein
MSKKYFSLKEIPSYFLTRRCNWKGYIEIALSVLPSIRLSHKLSIKWKLSLDCGKCHKMIKEKALNTQMLIKK